jgi:hypothetical protein
MATRMVTVDVTQEDIDGGTLGSACGCPLALAGTRATGERLSVGIVSIGHRNFRWRVDLPDVALEFRRAFDAGLPVRPIAFPLRVPVTTEAPGAQR